MYHNNIDFLHINIHKYPYILTLLYTYCYTTNVGELHFQHRRLMIVIKDNALNNCDSDLIECTGCIVYVDGNVRIT